MARKLLFRQGMKLVPFVCCAALLVRASDALACGATAEPYYVPSEQSPTGAGVPLNTPLVVGLSESDGGPGESHLNPSLTLTVEGTAKAIVLTPLGNAPHLAWVPQKPLAPSTTYEAHFNTGYEGHPDTIWQFTTGDELAPPVALEGEVSVTFEPGTVPINECGNNCGTDCRQVATKNVTNVRVRLPRAVQGFPKYHAEVFLTDHTPYDFSTGAPEVTAQRDQHLVNLSTWVSYDERGRAAEDAVFPLPEEAEPYRPCISVRLVDERGDAAVAPPFCGEESTFSHTSAGCNLGAVPSTHSHAALALLALAVVTRRRRSRSAL